MTGLFRVLLDRFLLPTIRPRFQEQRTDALNIVGHSIRWRPGDEVVVAADEFPSVRLAWSAAERAGGVVRLVEIPREEDREAALLNALSPRTRVLVAAHVHSITGTRIDLGRVGAACRRHGCLFVVDGIHALGATRVDLDQVDVYMSGVFKWLLAGFGLAICVIRDRAKQEMTPAFRGYLNALPSSSLQFAHINYPGVYALEASLRLLGDEVGWDEVYRQTAQLVEWLSESLRRSGHSLAAPPGARAGVASFAVADAEGVRARLEQKRIYVAARGRYLRVSPFIYNTRADVDRLVFEVAPFLP